ncbi:hypothetical protein [Paenibacillus sp. S02]|uniref:hypothetical protein n=1 Tax=Paenibacillus sp. S02 TaxID=2823904 RepID=UPI001C6540F7|nr:hypothetical protein [Paenibacillus sp. S02]
MASKGTDSSGISTLRMNLWIPPVPIVTASRSLSLDEPQEGTVALADAGYPLPEG